MAGMGPPPSPTARRPNATRGGGASPAMRLPAAGRPGRPPRWPLLPDIGLRAKLAVVEAKVEGLEFDLQMADPDRRGPIERQLDAHRERLEVLRFQVAEQEKRERALWRELWKTPQASAWDAHGWTRDVAQYCRHKVLAELGSLDDAKEARQWSDRLGLNDLALLRLRWVIEDQAPNLVAVPDGDADVIELYG